jgi:hypothetical protein
MSTGGPSIIVDVPKRVLMQCREYLEERAALALVSPWTLSELVIVALCEKLDRIRRARKRSRRVLQQTELDDFLPLDHSAIVAEELAEGFNGGGG